MTDRNHLVEEENRRIRLLRISSDLLCQVLSARSADTSQAEAMIRGLRKLAGKLFPGKESVFDMIHLPRFRRALRAAGAREMPQILKVLDRGSDQATVEEK